MRLDSSLVLWVLETENLRSPVGAVMFDHVAILPLLASACLRMAAHDAGVAQQGAVQQLSTLLTVEWHKALAKASKNM